MNALEFRLLNEFQRDFPVCARPYLSIAERLATSEADVLSALAKLHANGAVSRIGATIVPGRLGAATLAALATPAHRVVDIGAVVSEYPEVNHNYERDHRYNLWFVVTAPSHARVQEVVRDIERRAQCGRALNLPMIAAFHVDLGFDLGGRAVAGVAERVFQAGAPYAPAADEARVLAALQDGMAVTPRPYAELAARAGSTEGEVMAALSRLLAGRVIRRIGVIVSHRDLGYCANAMAVWDVPDEAAPAAGARLAQEPGVSLCYQRRRDAPLWPYNLYCMLHGTDRAAATWRAASITLAAGLARYPRALLFSTRRFKQCAAHYVA